jgi:hypothetical protein
LPSGISQIDAVFLHKIVSHNPYMSSHAYAFNNLCGGEKV